MYEVDITSKVIPMTIIEISNPKHSPLRITAKDERELHTIYLLSINKPYCGGCYRAWSVDKEHILGAIAILTAKNNIYRSSLNCQERHFRKKK